MRKANVVVWFLGIFVGGMANAVEPVLTRPLTMSEKKPLLVYYAVDIELPLLTAAVNEDASFIRTACETQRTDAIVFLQSDYLKETGSYFLCKQGKTVEAKFDGKTLAALEEGRQAFLLGREKMEEKWNSPEFEALDFYLRPVGLDASQLKISFDNPYTVGEWLRRALLEAGRHFPFAQYDYFLVVKGIGNERGILNALNKQGLEKFREDQLAFLAAKQLEAPKITEPGKRGRGLPEAYDWAKLAQFEDPSVVGALPKEVGFEWAGLSLSALGATLMGNPGEFAFVIIESGPNAVEKDSTMWAAFKSLEEVRGFYSPGKKRIFYRTLDWKDLLTHWHANGGTSARLYEDLAAATSKIVTK